MRKKIVLILAGFLVSYAVTVLGDEPPPYPAGGCPDIEVVKKTIVTIADFNAGIRSGLFNDQDYYRGAVRYDKFGTNDVWALSVTNSKSEHQNDSLIKATEFALEILSAASGSPSPVYVTNTNTWQCSYFVSSSGTMPSDEFVTATTPVPPLNPKIVP